MIQRGLPSSNVDTTRLNVVSHPATDHAQRNVLNNGIKIMI